ncbi:MAG: transglutaminaseTgpA domain-containing protein, partial [Acidimicrobiales bacterium]
MSDAIERKAPTVALGGLMLAMGAAAVATGEVNIGLDITFPAVLLVAVFGAGVFLSLDRWSAGPPRPAPLNLGITFVVAFALIVTRATQGGGDPPGGLHGVAEVFVIVLTIRSFALTDATRVRSALLMTMGAVLAASASGPVSEDLAAVVVWLVAAVVTLLALVEVTLSGLPRLTTTTPRAPRPQRLLAAGATVLVVVALAAAVVVIVDPDPGAPGSRSGQQADGPPQGQYDWLSPVMDTGSRVKPGHEVVLTVQAPAPDFWRGQTFDRWDGRVWTRSRSASSFPADGSGYVQPGVGDVDIGGQTFVQHFTVKASAMQVLFGAYRVDQIDTPVAGMIVHGDGAIELDGPIGRGTEYTVVSVRQNVTRDALREHDPVPADIPPYVSTPYLQLPDVPDRVTALAHELTDGELTAYDKVQAIHRWLGSHVEYTLDIPPLPDGADAVDQFLFVDKKGFCEQIATSTAVLLRTVGVPARVATGYVPGDESLLGGEFTVRADDAHAWVEVWFPGIGWQAFDPTASVPLAGETSSTAGERFADLLA